MSERAVRAERHMSDFEALMWNLDKDPRLSSNMANLTMFDTAPDFDAFRDTMERASIVFPRLRQRVAPVFGRVAPPRWEIDPNFDLNYHLRRISLGGRGTRAELHELAAQLYVAPFDRTRPLWEFVLIDGLRGGKAAMVQRLHHTITDGEGGLALSLEFIDFTRDAPQRTPVAPPQPPDHNRTMLDSMGDALVHVGRRQIGIARRSVLNSVQAVTHPSSIVSSTNAAAGFATAAAKQVQTPTHPMSPLWQSRSLSRVFDSFDVPFAESKRAAATLGGTLNDLFVAGAAGAAGAYHRAFGEDPAELRMAMPISGRTDKSIGGNSFSPTQTAVPTGEMSPSERMALIHELLHRAKSNPTVAATGALAGVINLLPTSVVTRTGYRFAGATDFVTSNLRAAPMPVYLAGARMDRTYPMGPLAGAAFNITTMSYNGAFNMGVVIDTAAITDPPLLLKCLKAEFRSLLRAGGRD